MLLFRVMVSVLSLFCVSVVACSVLPAPISVLPPLSGVRSVTVNWPLASSNRLARLSIAPVPSALTLAAISVPPLMVVPPV
ncbi:hypothetical protein NGUA38_01256 [Salmonella enterica]|nr:hypothetical protein NGUA38_01256 [Salmonella enterica]